jgi:hypothetical protein
MNAGIFQALLAIQNRKQRLATRTPTAIRTRVTTTTTIRRRAGMLVLLSFDTVDIGRCVIPLSPKKKTIASQPSDCCLFLLEHKTIIDY